jgi:hypothetical protein
MNSGVRSVMPDISSYQTKHPNTHGSFLQCSNELKGQQAFYIPLPMQWTPFHPCYELPRAAATLTVATSP